jgi:hypothetical protein
MRGLWAYALAGGAAFVILCIVGSSAADALASRAVRVNGGDLDLSRLTFGNRLALAWQGLEDVGRDVGGRMGEEKGQFRLIMFGLSLGAALGGVAYLYRQGFFDPHSSSRHKGHHKRKHKSS